MNYLLDTHIIIWWLERSKRLPNHVYELINNPNNNIFVSTVSIWEISIKTTIGKLDTPNDIKEMLPQYFIKTLNITIDHALWVSKLPLYHRDPFDRMLIAQAQVEGLTIITSDRFFDQYDVVIIK